MATTLVLDPSLPYQTCEDLLVFWLPRGRGRNALAAGLVALVDICDNPACPCTDARLQVLPIDDRAVRAERNDGHLYIYWDNQGDEPPRAEGLIKLVLDTLTGVVTASNDGELPSSVAPFFAEPIPFWVLDHLWDRWRAPRLPLGTDWRAQALKHWEPGLLLSKMLAFPEERFDRYVLDGEVFQVDTLFCVEPRCTCKTARLAVYSVGEDARCLREVGSAWLPFETMFPQEFEGDGLDLDAFVRIYLQWRQRNAPAEERLLELRDLTRERGRELLRFAASHSRPEAGMSRAAPPRLVARSSSPLPASGPGRNAPCPCGSGKKYKRCCGK
jgi:hypothetical protein